MSRRILTAVIFLIVVTAGFVWPEKMWGHGPLLLLMATVAVMCVLELCVMMRKKGLRVYKRVASWGVLALMVEAGWSHMHYSALLFGMAVCAAWAVRMRGKVEGAWGDVSATCFSMAYIGIPMAAITKLYLTGAESRAWLIFGMCVIWSTDSFALFVGKAMGRHKLSPKISPGKTVEGSIGGIGGALAAAAVAWFVFGTHFRAAGMVEFLLFTVIFSIIAQIGDLAESMLKRDVGVKDSGSALTGHGGFLDLMDAALFCAAPLLFYLQVFHPDIVAAR
ncbi:phosphatidate cytidylyltransferase [soil metagenome]